MAQAAHTNRYVIIAIILTSFVWTVSARTAKLDTSLLPAPVFEEEPGYVDLYWKAWELAYDHISSDEGAVHFPECRLLYRPDSKCGGKKRDHAFCAYGLTFSSASSF